MNVRHVDPRDIEVETPVPIYRVYLWNEERTRSDEYELTEARNVREVIDWAEGRADGRRYDLMVVDRQAAWYLIRSDEP
ncbi:MAG: hypothetical protein QOF68_829 [Gaiellales bacterium]|nr:hypothetical protein [Gaiellales bacterium]